MKDVFNTKKKGNKIIIDCVKTNKNKKTPRDLFVNVVIL